MSQDSHSESPKAERKSWPLSWILIIILIYIALQTAFFLFVAD